MEGWRDGGEGWRDGGMEGRDGGMDDRRDRIMGLWGVEGWEVEIKRKLGNLCDQVLPMSIFVVMLGNKFYFCNQTRVQERLHYQKLLRDFNPKFWRELNEPVVLTPKSIQNNIPDVAVSAEVIEECWRILTTEDINHTLVR
jgi:hypothetical protein